MRTVQAMFQREADAVAARERLLSLGVAAQRVSVLERARATRVGSDDAAGKSRGLWANLKEMVSIPGDDRPSFEDHLKHGGFLVTASVPEERLSSVVAALEKEGVVDIDQEGFGAHSGAGRSEAEERIPLVEEQLHVGKQGVGGDQVRVRAFPEERPVHERVFLYDYRVSVGRRSADQQLAQGGKAASLDDLFKERVIEMTETTDEVVFEKQARVREEVVVRKEAHERVEEVDTTVRRTEVEVERIPTSADRDRLV
jgi:stress response protein YsnF